MKPAENDSEIKPRHGWTDMNFFVFDVFLTAVIKIAGELVKGRPWCQFGNYHV